MKPIGNESIAEPDIGVIHSNAVILPITIDTIPNSLIFFCMGYFNTYKFTNFLVSINEEDLIS